MTSNRLDKRELILAKGSEVMTRRGYHGTGVLEIVQAARIPKGSFYHYFDSKEAFAQQALEHVYAPRLARYAQALGDSRFSPRERCCATTASCWSTSPARKSPNTTASSAA